MRVQSRSSWPLCGFLGLCLPVLDIAYASTGAIGTSTAKEGRHVAAYGASHSEWVGSDVAASSDGSARIAKHTAGRSTPAQDSAHTDQAEPCTPTPHRHHLNGLLSTTQHPGHTRCLHPTARRAPGQEHLARHFRQGLGRRYPDQVCRAVPERAGAGHRRLRIEVQVQIKEIPRRSFPRPRVVVAVVAACSPDLVSGREDDGACQRCGLSTALRGERARAMEEGAVPDTPTCCAERALDSASEACVCCATAFPSTPSVSPLISD
eukprot:831766-Rhodomonas_salina.2